MLGTTFEQVSDTPSIYEDALSEFVTTTFNDVVELSEDSALSLSESLEELAIPDAVRVTVHSTITETPTTTSEDLSSFTNTIHYRQRLQARQKALAISKNAPVSPEDLSPEIVQQIQQAYSQASGFEEAGLALARLFHNKIHVSATEDAVLAVVQRMFEANPELPDPPTLEELQGVYLDAIYDEMLARLKERLSQPPSWVSTLPTPPLVPYICILVINCPEELPMGVTEIWLSVDNKQLYFWQSQCFDNEATPEIIANVLCDCILDIGGGAPIVASLVTDTYVPQVWQHVTERFPDVLCHASPCSIIRDTLATVYSSETYAWVIKSIHCVLDFVAICLKNGLLPRDAEGLQGLLGLSIAFDGGSVGKVGGQVAVDVKQDHAMFSGLLSYHDDLCLWLDKLGSPSRSSTTDPPSVTMDTGFAKELGQIRELVRKREFWIGVRNLEAMPGAFVSAIASFEKNASGKSPSLSDACLLLMSILHDDALSDEAREFIQDRISDPMRIAAYLDPFIPKNLLDLENINKPPPLLAEQKDELAAFQALPEKTTTMVESGGGSADNESSLWQQQTTKDLIKFWETVGVPRFGTRLARHAFLVFGVASTEKAVNRSMECSRYAEMAYQVAKRRVVALGPPVPPHKRFALACNSILPSP